jgi:succinyl-CoA synthetase beta subunit
MDKFGVTTQRGEAATTAAGARKAAEAIKKKNPNAELILKAQIHAGGRGKGTFTDGFKGGVKICKTPQEVEDYAKKMLGNTLVTIQTGPAGQKVGTVLVNEGISIASEKYFAILMDRKYNGPVLVASAQGGMDIETVAHDTPEKIIKEPVDIMKGIQPEQTLRVAKALGFKAANIPAAQKQMEALYKLFIGTDATQVEINPLAEGKYSNEGETVFCVDAKLNFDDNASFRQKEVYAMRDKSMEDPRDVRAEEAGLNFVGLDGSIGCLVNGAGLAMATMDIINLHGGKPANFLDVGGSATAPMVTEAFRILTSDKNVKGILVNIFGGIMKCDVIAQGVVQAFKEVGLKIPLIVRLEGTNVELGKKVFKDSGVPIIVAADLDDAAIKAVKAISK